LLDDFTRRLTVPDSPAKRKNTVESRLSNAASIR
jgi:hypothetical protein